MSERSDPVGDKHYKPLKRAELAADLLFYLLAALSLGLLMASRERQPEVYDALQVAFIVLVIVGGTTGFAIRQYFGPRAGEKRRQDLLSHTFSVGLIHDRSHGYYNNEQSEPLRRLAADTLESSLFTSAILRKMLGWERARILIYFVLFLVLIMWRSTDLGVVGIAAQVLFGEQVLSRYLKTEWLRMQAERVYSSLHALMSANRASPSPEVQARILEQYSNYEVAKATAGISLSQRTFDRLNPSLKVEWEAVKQDTGL